LVGVTSADLVRRAVREDGTAFPPNDYPAAVALRTGLPCTGVTMGFGRTDGNTTWISLDATPLRVSGVRRDLRRYVLSSADGVACDAPVRLGRPVTADFYGKRKVAGTVVEGPWNALLSDAAGEPVRLVRANEPGAGHDDHPVTLLGEESVAELARRSGAGSVDARRFRMLISFSGLPAHIEDCWQDRAIEIGEAVVRVGGPVPRCAATTRDPDRGVRDLPTVRMIRSYRGVQANESGPGVNFGVYADVVAEGVVRVGDPLRVQSAGPP